MNNFTSCAEVVVDGVRQAPVSRVFTSKIDHDIIMVKDTDGKLVPASPRKAISFRTGATPMPLSPRKIWMIKS
jgi:hypothetical protein